MDRLLAMVITVGMAILIMTVIIYFYLNFRVGPPQGSLLDIIGKAFGV